MSISYRVIQNHYGSINVESEVGQGATFTIVIPINHQNGNNIPALTSKDINDNEAQG